MIDVKCQIVWGNGSDWDGPTLKGHGPDIVERDDLLQPLRVGPAARHSQFQLLVADDDVLRRVDQQHSARFQSTLLAKKRQQKWKWNEADLDDKRRAVIIFTSTS